MNQSRPSPQHADAIHSGDFAGNLQRASLLPGEIATRPPVSQELRAAAGTGGYPQPGGVSIYRRHLIDTKWPHQDGSHMSRGVERPWWRWPAIATLVTLAVGGLVLVISDSAAGAAISLMLRKLI
jgi:hypothetical protein